MEVILKVTEVRANSQYAKSGVTMSPVGDVLYLVNVPDECQINSETGEKYFDANGIRHIIRGLHVVLVIDTDKEDF